MPDKSYKAFERRVCSWFGGTRRGPILSTVWNKNDCMNTKGYSVEVKLYSRPSFQVMLDACTQAEQAREHPEDMAVAVVKRKNDLDSNSLVIMKRDEFLRWKEKYETSSSD